MRLVKYLFGLALVRCGGALAILALIYGSIDLVEAASMASASLGDVLLAYPFKLPSVITHVLPLACAIGVLLTLSHLRRKGEWEALTASGVSPLRLAGALLVVPLVLTMVAFPLTAVWAPNAYALFDESVGIGKAGDEVDGANWSKDGRLLIRRAKGAGLESAVVVIERDERGKAIRRLETGDPGSDWKAREGWRSPDSKAEELPPLKPLPRLPTLGADGLIGAGQSSPRLSRLARELEERGLDSGIVSSQIALRIALAAATFIVAALSLLWGAASTSVRETRLVPRALLVAAAYWFLVAFSWNGAVWGVLPSWVLSVGVPGFTMAVVLLCALRLGRASIPRR